MAEVWMGRRGAVGGVSKAVAIKMLAPALANQSHYRELFVDEARLSMLLSHSNIVQVFDVGEDGDTSYLVMEWVDGLNLAQIAELLRRSATTMPLPVTAYVVGELLHALAYAHTVTHDGKPLGIVHRDVSPQNVLISVSGEVKLTDFGVARLASDDTSGLHIKGKLRYMAPEQLAGHSRLGGVDLYAVGAILHELLEGRRFRGEGVDDAYLYAQVTGGVVPELDNDQIPPELDVLRRALLEPDKSRRLSTAADALAVLEAWPGYRNASIELGKMCRWFMGVQAPRSGLQERVEPPHSVEVPIVISGETTRTADHRVDLDSEALTLAAGPDPWFRRWIPLAGGMAGLLGVASLIMWYAGGALEAPLDSVQTDPAPREDPVAVAREASESAESGRPPKSGVTLAAERAIMPATTSSKPFPRSAARPSPATSSSSRQRLPPSPPEASRPESETVGHPRAVATVSMGLSGLRLAFVRIDGKSVHALQPTAEAELLPGRHRIEWRLTENEPWQPAVPIRLRSGRDYELRVGVDGPKLSNPGR